MVKFGKCSHSGCIHYCILVCPNERFPNGIGVHFASKEGGRNLLRQGERIGAINTEDARQIRQQIETTLGLPETHQADMRPGCTRCSVCYAYSTFILSPSMALHWYIRGMDL